MIPTIEEIRKQYPKIPKDASDRDIITNLYEQFYKDKIPAEQFFAHYKMSPDPATGAWDPHREEMTLGQRVAGTIGRATEALPESAGRPPTAEDWGHLATGLWSFINNPPSWDQIKGAVGESWEELKKHYGTMERARKTFETNPVQFVADVSSLAGGVTTVAKIIATGVGKVGRAVLPELVRGTEVTPATLRSVGEAGRMAPGTVAKEEYKAALKGQPSPSAPVLEQMRTPAPGESRRAASVLGTTTPAGSVELTPSARIAEATRAFESEHVTPWRETGQRMREAGWLPPLGELGTYLRSLGLPGIGTASAMPRLMGAGTYGAGTLERWGANIPGTRPAIMAAAAALLKDKDEKNKRTPDELKTLRAARVPNASSVTLQRARQILAGRTPQMRIETGFADLPSYGGPSGDTPTPPSPGESSQPVARQYGGPVEAGQPARVGEEGREMFVPDEQRGDPTKAAGQLASKLWEMLKSGGEDLIGKLHKTAMELTYDPQGFEKYDPSGPMGAAMLVTGGRMPFARAGEMGVGGGKMTQPGIKAYHGSPHEFEKFSTEHIGTGEGAQAYGHGLYFAENPRVAEEYKRSLAGRLKEGSGKMYEVNIKAEREHFLDWDKPLSEQSKHVQDKLKELNMFPDPARIEKIIKERQASGMGESKYLLEKLADEQKRLQMPASQLHWEMGPKSNVSEQLKKAGIPGIKYLDQGSRRAGQGTSNFVVFNDALIDIIRKYGIAAIAAIPPALSETQKQ
jgi:hypothetical protein